LSEYQFKSLELIQQAESGISSSTEYHHKRNHRFTCKPNAPNCDHPGCKLAKAVHPPQDDLKKVDVGELMKSQADKYYSEILVL
jgi:hypothetical protein